MQKIVQFWKSGVVGKIVVIVGLLLLVCICCSTFSLVSTSSPTYKATATARAAVQATELAQPTNTLSPTTTPAPTNTLGPTATSGPTDTPAPTNTLAPTETPQPTLSPSENLHQSIVETLGKSNRDVERLSEFEVTDEVFIQWAINDNFTENMIKSGTQIDITNMLKTIASSGVTYGSVRLYGTFPLVDKYGNVTETTVVKVVYRLDTIQKINWDNFLFKNVYDIADSKVLHPTFQ
jgi:hypothetical protein